MGIEMTPEEYKAAIQADFENSGSDEPTKLSYVGERIFCLCTDDDDATEKFAVTGLKICEAITTRNVYEYHGQSESHYFWFLLFMNLPFFSSTTDFGTSIRGSFWSVGYPEPYELKYLELKFSNTREWEVFMKALIEWVME